MHPLQVRRACPETLRHLTRLLALLIQPLSSLRRLLLRLRQLGADGLRLAPLYIRSERAHDRIRRPRERHHALTFAGAQPHDAPRLTRLVESVKPRHQRLLAHDGVELVHAERADALQQLAVQVVQGLVHLGVEPAQGGGELLRGVASRLMRLWTSAKCSNEGIRVGITCIEGSRGRDTED